MKSTTYVVQWKPRKVWQDIPNSGCRLLREAKEELAAYASDMPKYPHRLVKRVAEFTDTVVKETTNA